MTEPRTSDRPPWWRRHWRLLVTVGSIVLLAYSVAAATVLPIWIVSLAGARVEDKVRLNEIDNTRGTLLGLLAPLLVAIGAVTAFLNYRETTENNRRTYDLSRREQVTDRFTKAIDQLGQLEVKKLAVRIGGIYALEQIAFDSKELHWPAMEVLTAFLRANSKSSPHTAKEADDEKAAGPPDDSDQAEHRITALEASVISAQAAAPKPTVAADLQAIATVLGRRPEHRRREEEKHGRQLDLSHVRLAGFYFADAHLETANMFSADLEGADLHSAHLEGTNLIGAHLKEANLTGAHLVGAHLDGAHLAAAHLDGAQLDDAWFNGARLEGATLFDAHLKGANLIGANLQGTDLTRAQLDAALVDESTILPAHLMKGPSPAILTPDNPQRGPI